MPWSIQSTSGPRTGQFSLSDYVSPRFADMNGYWMGLPQAVRDLRESRFPCQGVILRVKYALADHNLPQVLQKMRYCVPDCSLTSQHSKHGR